MKKALVTGASGFVGSYLCRELLAHDYEVTAFHRPSSSLENISELPLQYATGDVRDPASLRAAFAGHNVVFHIAALFREAKHADSVYHDINVAGVRNVFEAAIAENVSQVIHCSTVGVHSHIPHPPADETEEYRPGDIYQETKCEGEKIALQYFQSERMRGSVIRPAMIWGPGDTRTLKLFRGIADRRFPLIGTGKTLVHWVMVSDLARGFRLAAEKSSGKGEIYIIAGEAPVPMKEMIAVIAKEFGVAPPRIRIPALPVQLLGDIVEAVCVPFGIEPPIYRRRVDFFTKTRAFDCSKARREIDYAPEGNFSDEVHRIASWYLEKGWIDTR